MKIRLAEERDIEAIASLLGQLGYPSRGSDVLSRLRIYLADNRSISMVAEWGDRVIGLISFHRIPLLHESGDLGRITALVVDESHRRKGIARSLIQAIEEYGRNNGCARFEVTTNEKRKDAHSLYQAMGYEPVLKRFLKSELPKG